MMRFTDLILQLFHAQQTRWHDTLLDFTDGWHQAWITVTISLNDFSSIQSRKLCARRRVKAVHALQWGSRIIHRTFDDVIDKIALKIQSAFEDSRRCVGDVRLQSVLAIRQNRDNRHRIWIVTAGPSISTNVLAKLSTTNKVSTIFTLRASWGNSREWILFVSRRQRQLEFASQKKSKTKMNGKKIRQFSLFTSKWKWIWSFDDASPQVAEVMRIFIKFSWRRTRRVVDRNLTKTNTWVSKVPRASVESNSLFDR